MAKVMVGMSGGVDSSVAAKLLIDKGYEVTGVTLKLFEKESYDDVEEKTCCSLRDVEDAKSVCRRLGIEHFVFNFKDEFQNKVIDTFVKSYLKGETPNPCIECNKHIKFDKMLRRADELEYDYIATGHYAVREFDRKLGKFILKRPKDRSKDQTYVLYGLTQRQLSRTLFPLGEYEKSSIRTMAENAGLINFHKPDSQDICFVPDGDYAAFIRNYTGEEPKEGDFITGEGKILGTHKGIINYTVGQRRGIGIALGKPTYVVNKNYRDNTVTIGEEKELYKSRIIINNINLISLDSLEDKMRVTAKIRYSKNEQPATIENLPEGKAAVTFDSPQRAPAVGQACVFYQGDVVIGGGTIIG